MLEPIHRVQIDYSLRTFNAEMPLARELILKLESDPMFQCDPIIVHDGKVVDGFLRINCYKEAGRTHIPVRGI